eukprot:scaffold862_cov76-Skeletonema_dohrnii-CCMP3373.AAC.6
MPLHQRRSVQGSAQQAHTTDAASAAAVSFLIGGSALNEACDILLAQRSSQPSASCPQQTESQNQTNEDHCQKLAALYQKGKAAYNIICRADDASTALSSEIMSIMTPGNLAATSSSAVNSTQSSSSLSTTVNNTPLPRSRGSFSTPHGNKSKMTPGLIHRKRSSMESGGRIISRSLSDTSDVSNNSSGNHNSHRGGGKSAINTSAAKKQQQQQKPRKADPPPEVLNFLKALNSGGSAAAPASTPPSSSPSTTTATAAASTNNDSNNNTSNSRKRPPASSYAPKKSARKRQPPPPRRQPSRSSTDEDDHDDDEANEGTAPTTTTKRRTRSTRRGVSSITDTNTRVYGIGESVFVQVEGKHYNAIVKNVDFKADDEDEEGDDAMKQHRAVYEVEFSDGEVWEDVGDDDVHSADEEEY